MKLQLKRSSIYTGTTTPAAYKPTAPTSAQTLFGELCVNYNDGDPALFVKTEAGTIARVDGNEKHYNLSTATNASGAQIDLLHKSSGINIQTTESTINFTGNTGVTVSQPSTGTIDIAISGADDIGVDLVATRSATNNVIECSAGNDATLTGASGTEAGLLLPADKTKLDNLPTLGSGGYDDRYVQVTGDSMTGGLTIDPGTDDADALITGAGHDIKLGAGANIVFDNAQDTTIQPNSSAAAAVDVTLPVSSGTVTIEPTSDGSYLRKHDSGTVSWVLISDDTDGAVTSITGGDGIDVTDGGTSNPTIAVDPNLGIEVGSNGVSTKMHTGGGLVNNLGTNSDELGIQNGGDSNQILVWKGANRVNAVNVAADPNNESIQPAGSYTNVATTQDVVSDPAATGLTVSFTVAADSTVASATVVNPGQGYTNGETLSVVGHGNLNVVVNGVTANAEWVVENYTGGSGGGGDVTNVVGGQGITVDSSAGPSPEVSFAPTADGGLTFSDNTDDATVGVDLGASAIGGTVAINHGGTGLSTAPTNGQLLIGNGTGYTLATLTEGTNIVITEAAGSITIATGLTTAQGSGVFQLNEQTVTADYTIPNGYNAVSAGPITINDGVTVTVDDGEHWSIV